MEKNGKKISLLYPVQASKHREERFDRKLLCRQYFQHILSPDRWFHPNLTSAEAEEKLLSINDVGAFLVRERGSKARDFVLSCLVKEGDVVHVVITTEVIEYCFGYHYFIILFITNWCFIHTERKVHSRRRHLLLESSQSHRRLQS